MDASRTQTAERIKPLMVLKEQIVSIKHDGNTCTRLFRLQVHVRVRVGLVLNTE